MFAYGRNTRSLKLFAQQLFVMHFVTQCASAHKSWNAQKYPDRGLLNQFSINRYEVRLLIDPKILFKGCKRINLWSWKVCRYAIEGIKVSIFLYLPDWSNTGITNIDGAFKVWSANGSMISMEGVNNQNLAEYNITACAEKEVICRSKLSTTLETGAHAARVYGRVLTYVHT